VLGGTINVSSHVGSGTEFVLRIPRLVQKGRARVAESTLMEAAS